MSRRTMADIAYDHLMENVDLKKELLTLRKELATLRAKAKAYDGGYERVMIQAHGGMSALLVAKDCREVISLYERTPGYTYLPVRICEVVE